MRIWVGGGAIGLFAIESAAIGEKIRQTIDLGGGISAIDDGQAFAASEARVAMAGRTQAAWGESSRKIAPWEPKRAAPWCGLAGH